jgi:hypothetical protein
MSAHIRLSWRGVMMLAGVSYGFIGIVFALPPSHAHVWRLTAWVISAAVYVTHVAYERWGLHVTDSGGIQRQRKTTGSQSRKPSPRPSPKGRGRQTRDKRT